MNQNHEILFEETQHLPKWIWIFLIPPTLLFWGVAGVQIFSDMKVGNQPLSDTGAILMALLFGFLFPASVIFMKAQLVVTKQDIKISIFPIYWKKSNLKILLTLTRWELNHYKSLVAGEFVGMVKSGHLFWREMKGSSFK